MTERSMHPVIMAIDCLQSSKYQVLRDSLGAMESASPQLRQAFAVMSQEHLNMAREWFQLMQNRGWYQIPAAQTVTMNQAGRQMQALNLQTAMGQQEAGHWGGPGRIF